jgi:hypothetical protein
MGFGLRIAPGVRVSASSRGLRASVGPRAARVHVGSGRTGFSTGAGPLTYYTSLGGSGGRRRSTSVPSYEREMRRLEREQAFAEAAAAHERLLEDFLNAHMQSFDDARPPVAKAREEVPLKELEQREWAEARKGLPFWRRAERQLAKAQAKEGAAKEYRELEAESETGLRLEQLRLNEAWARLLANDEQTVLEVMEAAFEDNESPAAATAVEGDAVSIVMRFPSLEYVVPERKPALTPTGKPTLKMRPKGERNSLYLAGLMSHVLITAKEAFAVAPGISETSILVIQGQEETAFPRVVPVFAARLERELLRTVPWEDTDAADIMSAKASAVAANIKGRTSQLDPLDLSTEPALAIAADQLAAQLGWESARN